MTPIQALRHIAANPLTPPQIRDVAMQGIANAEVESIVHRAKNELPAQYIDSAHKLLAKQTITAFQNAALRV